MRPAWAFVALAGVFALAESRGESEPADLSRGASVAKTRHYRFEVYFYRTGVRVFTERREGTPLTVSGLAGTATFYHPNSPKPWFSRPLSPATSASSLDLAVGLGEVPAAGVKVRVTILGLPEPAEPEATFTVPLAFVAASAATGTVASTRPARPRDGVLSLFRDEYDPGSEGLGDYPFTRLDTTLPLTTAPAVSRYGYGRGASASPGGPLPYVSGHGVFLMPSADRDVPLARSWLRPTD